MLENVSFQVIQVDTVENGKAKWGSILSKENPNGQVVVDQLGKGQLRAAFDESDLKLYILNTGKYRFSGSAQEYDSIDDALATIAKPGKKVFVYEKNTAFHDQPDQTKIWETAKPYIIQRAKRM